MAIIILTKLVKKQYLIIVNNNEIFNVTHTCSVGAPMILLRMPHLAIRANESRK